MASATDLPGFLRNDDDSVEMRLTGWLSSLTKPEIPASIRLWWKPTGMLSEELLDEVAIDSLPAQTALVVDEIAKKIRDKLGPQPDGGTIRLKACKKGMKMSADVDMSRKLTAGHMSDADLNVALVKGENDRLRAENMDLRRTNVELNKNLTSALGSMTVLVGSQSKDIATLGTARGTAAAADEMSGLTTIIGMLTLYFFFPELKRSMGLAANASVKDVVDAGRRMISGGGAGVGAGEGPSAPLPLPPPGAGRLSSPSPEPMQPAPTPALSAGDVVDRISNDERFRRDLAKRVMSNPELLSQLQDAAFAGDEEKAA